MSNSLIEITAIEIKELAVVEPKQASEKFELIEKLCRSNDIKMVVLFPNRPEEFNHRPVPAKNN